MSEIECDKLDDRVQMSDALDERRAVLAWLLDRAEQYPNSSKYRCVFDELIGDIADGEHVISWDCGELDDLKPRVLRLMDDGSL